MVVTLSLLSFSAYSQNFNVGTNLFDWGNYGTINAEAGVSLSQHYSIVAGLKCNPWDFSKGGDAVHNKMFVAFAGARYWPWYVNSGLWFQGIGQFADYSIAGTWRHALDKGTAAGVGVSAGYTYMLSAHFNVEFGLGCWAGYLFKHSLYQCSNCMILRELESGPRAFIDFNNITLSVAYVF